MRTRIAFLGALLALAAPLAAQTKDSPRPKDNEVPTVGEAKTLVKEMIPKIDSSGHAYIYASAIKDGSISKAAYVKAVRNCDRKVLQINCEELIIASTSFIPGGHKYESLNALADYMDTLVEQECRVSPVVMSRVRLGKAERWPRATRKGERCLYDNNLGLDVFSLSCGNIIVDANVPERLVMTQVESPEPTPSSVTAPTTANAQVGVVPPPQPKTEPVVQTQQQTEPKKGPGYWHRNWGWYVGGLVTGVTGYLVADNNPQWFRRGKDVVKIDIHIQH